jgi:hypothetical protein
MNGKPVFVALVLSCVAAAQRQPEPKGMIHGTVIRQDGMPSIAIRLVAEPLDGALSTVLPHTTTNDTGEYRFENLPWWGRYTVYADDEKAGYSQVSTGPAGDGHPPEVEITPEKPKAELNITLPPKAGFVQIHLKNRNTGAAISTMAIRVVSMENPEPFLFTMSCDSGRVILVPPGKNLLLHVKSDRFREWDESEGTGKFINLPSGNLLTLDVTLDPSN